MKPYQEPSDRWMRNRTMDLWTGTAEMYCIIGHTTQQIHYNDFPYINNRTEDPRSGYNATCNTGVSRSDIIGLFPESNTTEPSQLLYLKERLKYIYSELQYIAIQGIINIMLHDDSPVWLQGWLYEKFDNFKNISINVLEEPEASDFMETIRKGFNFDFDIFDKKFKQDDFDLVQFVVEKLYPDICNHEKLTTNTVPTFLSKRIEKN